jgi:predicted permease
MCVRLRPGISEAQAQTQLDELNLRTLKRDPFAKMVVEGAGYHPAIRSLHTVMVDSIKPILLLLQVGAAFLFLIGAVNLANLLMVRAVGRAREYSVRRALGAGSARLGRSLIIEILLLSVTGGALGLGIGICALRVTIQYFTDRLPFEVPIEPDWTVCAVTFGGAVLTGLLLSVPVLWQSLRSSLAESLSAESRSGTTTRSVQRFRLGLIVAQIALAFVLLSGTGLLSLSLSKILSVNPGFRPENVLTGMVSLPGFRFPDAKRKAIVLRISERLRGLPGVSSSGIATPLPFTGSGGGAAIVFRNHKLTAEESAQPHALIFVAGDYFTALRVPLAKGRFLSDSDVEAERMVCVVDTNFAQRYWPKGDALGGGITPDSGPNPEFYTIVGIVGSVKQNDLSDEKDFGMIYLPFYSNATAMIALRTTRDPASLGATLSKAIAQIDPDLAVTDVRLMTTRIARSLLGRRLSLALAGLYAGVALLLATIGIYGVLAYSVAQRRREIGVRMALGAQPSQILSMFLGSGLRMLAFSLPAGGIGALFLGRTMAGFLFGVSPTHVGVLCATAAVLAVAATAACLVPARRAAQVAPAEALRAT